MVRTTLFVVVTLLASQAAAVHRTIPMGAVDKRSAPSGAFSLQHTARIGRSILAEDFLRMFVRNAQSKKRLQRAWPSTSMHGQIWSSPAGDAPFQGEGIELYLDVDPKFGFAVPGKALDAAFAKWMSANPGVKNRFSPEHVAELKRGAAPFHSGFYDANALVGLYHIYPILGRRAGQVPNVAFNVVNLDGIRKIKMEIPWYHLEEIGPRIPGRKAKSTFILR